MCEFVCVAAGLICVMASSRAAVALSGMGLCCAPSQCSLCAGQVCASTHNAYDKLSGAAGGLSAQDYARKLPRTFSLQESDSSGVNEKELSNLQKVMTIVNCNKSSGDMATQSQSALNLHHPTVL